LDTYKKIYVESPPRRWWLLIMYIPFLAVIAFMLIMFIWLLLNVKAESAEGRSPVRAEQIILVRRS
jgi:hypothetical protein